MQIGNTPQGITGDDANFGFYMRKIGVNNIAQLVPCSKAYDICRMTDMPTYLQEFITEV